MVRESYFLDPVAKKRIKQDLCPICCKHKNEWSRRKDWKCCSTKCTKKFQETVSYTWSEFRELVFARDNKTCVSCGWKGRNWYIVLEDSPYHSDKKYYESHPNFLEFIQENGFEYAAVHSSNGLDCDHIIPIALGGSQWCWTNVQTLCKPCHKKKTKHDKARIAQDKRQKKHSSIGGLSVWKP